MNTDLNFVSDGARKRFKVNVESNLDVGGLCKCQVLCEYAIRSQTALTYCNPFPLVVELVHILVYYRLVIEAKDMYIHKKKDMWSSLV